MNVATVASLPAAALMRADAMRVLVLLRPTMARFAPSAASASAAAKPMPLVAPVIRMCLSFTAQQSHNRSQEQAGRQPFPMAAEPLAMCYPALAGGTLRGPANTSIQNNSGLPQGLAGLSVAVRCRNQPWPMGDVPSDE